MNLSLRVGLHGECRLVGRPAQPADLALDLRVRAPRRFVVSGELRSEALGDPRPVRGEWSYPDTLSLEFDPGLSYEGRTDAGARALVGRSLWVGPLARDGETLGELRLRLDWRHDWLQILRSVRPRAHAW